jgi:hypothetical protein
MNVINSISEARTSSYIQLTAIYSEYYAFERCGEAEKFSQGRQANCGSPENFSASKSSAIVALAKFPPINFNKSMKRFFILFCVLSLTGFAVTALGTKVLFQKPVTLHTLAALPIPTEHSVYLPGLYTARIIESPVLGAETINPRDIITYINEERMKRGAPPLRENKTLALAAQMRATVILKYQNFAHQDPYEHIQLDTVLPIVNYPFKYASENIGMGDSSARAFVNGFMSSTRHRANLLNPELIETGVALVTGPYKEYYVNIAVQLFAIPTTKERYLGYRKEDVNEYKQMLTDIEKQIELTSERINNHIGDEEYYEGWQKILIRQKEIISTLYNTMMEEQPFVKNLVAMISEYNTNWTLVPKAKI